MPLIEVKLAKQASRKQERILADKLGEAITLIPGKTEKGLMVDVVSDRHIYKGGAFLEYGASVNVVLKTGPSRTDCEKLNAAIFQIMTEDMKIPAENVYVTFAFCDNFGVNGTLL
jgi:phenylpyruvate tautomerase PptA (4-oxalocrotonate tautomerase family)